MTEQIDNLIRLNTLVMQRDYYKRRADEIANGLRDLDSLDGRYAAISEWGQYNEAVKMAERAINGLWLWACSDGDAN